VLEFVSGLITMGYFVAGIFFLRFWTRKRDHLFAAFCAAFWLLGLAQALLIFSPIPVEEQSWLFILRIAAFSLILAAIVAKNRRR
jgi:hypothetical protein